MQSDFTPCPCTSSILRSVQQPVYRTNFERPHQLAADMAIIVLVDTLASGCSARLGMHTAEERWRCGSREASDAGCPYDGTLPELRLHD